MPEGEAVAKPELKLVESAPDTNAAESSDGRAGTGPAQAEMPFAVVDGEAITELPQDLYILRGRWICCFT
jgi:segregation and condensation protein A